MYNYLFSSSLSLSLYLSIYLSISLSIYIHTHIHTYIHIIIWDGARRMWTKPVTKAVDDPFYEIWGLCIPLFYLFIWQYLSFSIIGDHSSIVLLRHVNCLHAFFILLTFENCVALYIWCSSNPDYFCFKK